MASNPDWLDTGDNAWQLTAASFVALQSVPGLLVLYAGIVKSKWAINSAFMSLYAFACVLICWTIWGYKVAFGNQMLPFAGYPAPVMTIEHELEQAVLPTAGLSPNFPQATMVYFQFVFAAITVIILSGALLGRMNFLAWMIFVPFWLTFSYCIGAFSLWGGGFLYKLGTIDYSGGYVIHLSSGTAGFVAAYWVGPRTDVDRADNRPNNMLCVLIGAGILWIGWNGFNGGDPYAASADAGVAVLNTNVCTAMSLLTWMVMDILVFKKPSILGAVNGMITGLVGITPAAGVVATWGAVCIGFATGTIPWMSMNGLKRYKFFHAVDDTLGIFHTHCVAGFVGGFCTGLFATTPGCAAFGITNPGGAIEGNGIQLGYQMAGACFIIGWNVVWTSLILLAIKLVGIPLRMTEEQLLVGDDAIHGESAYVFDDLIRLNGSDFRAQSNGDGELGIMGQELGNNHSITPAVNKPVTGKGTGEEVKTD
ncbi:MAG: hypothetical protein M1818_007485 [Claussenomyces sp. TS43310]|nr:MAG: hypothetical protein M1818_007485 [Claussenomyces sp. TS43310]